MARGVRVLPVLRPGSSVSELVPDDCRIINAVRWQDAGGEAARTILDALGIIEHERKVFVSYRRREGDWIANQLWDGLSRLRFDVFLDRFSIPPGENFQAMLDTELVDKAFVVIIESPTATKSAWVEHEVTYALAHHMGVLALTLPNVHERDRFPVVDDAFRVELAAGDLRGGRRFTIRSRTLRGVLTRIQREHAKLLRRRRAMLLGSTREFASRAGWTTKEVADWALLIRRDGEADSLLQVTPRSPRPIDLFRLGRLRQELQENGHITAGTLARLVHHSGSPDTEAELILRWMADGRDLAVTELSSLPWVL
jgi:hypothetical protein